MYSNVCTCYPIPYQICCVGQKCYLWGVGETPVFQFTCNLIHESTSISGHYEIYIGATINVLRNVRTHTPCLFFTFYSAIMLYMFTESNPTMFSAAYSNVHVPRTAILTYQGCIGYNKEMKHSVLKLNRSKSRPLTLVNPLPIY